MPNSSSDQGGQKESPPVVSSGPSRSTQELLAELLDLPPDQRPAAVDRLGLSAEQRQELLERLAHAQPTADFFSESPTLVRQMQDLESAAKEANEVIALNELLKHSSGPARRYKAMEKLGEGGFGSVFKAQQDGELERHVALKVLNLGMNSKQVIARFEQERQALALMNHPSIAAVHDAGLQSDGRPYFVMEYVPGKPITVLADERRLTIEQRLRLFQQVCDAVRHAHTKGIIHRDLKPANVLAWVEGNDVRVKVIDFGVAKALGGQLTDRSIHSGKHEIIGTLAYMSPEQARGDRDIDTRSDVYSLGVLLYELLAGLGPFAFDDKSEDEIKRIIIEQEPPKPSTRLSSIGPKAATLARQRQTDDKALRWQLGGELGWICLKAVKKDRRKPERYQSPEELSADIHNYLTGKPLVAGPDSTVYRTRKFIRRHQGLVAGALAVLVALGVGAVVSVHFAISADRRRVEAEQRRFEAEAINEFLRVDLLWGLSPSNMPDAELRNVIIARLIEPAAARVAERFKATPLVEAAVRVMLGHLFDSIGRPDLALQQGERALEIRRDILGTDHHDTLRSLNDYSQYMRISGHYREAERLSLHSLQEHRRILGNDHLETARALNNYATLLQQMGRLDEAEPLLKQALQDFRRLASENDPELLIALNNYADVLRELGRLSEAEPLFKESMEANRRVLDPDSTQTIQAIHNYAFVLHQLGDVDAASLLYAEALQRANRVLGSEHEITFTILANNAFLLQSIRRFSDAEPLFRQALAQSRRSLGEQHPRTLPLLNNHAYVLQQLGRLEEAEPLVAELFRASQSAELTPVQAARFTSWYGPLLVKLSRLDEAEGPLREAHRRLCETEQQSSERMAAVLLALIDLCERSNRSAEAAAWRAELAAVEAAGTEEIPKRAP